MWSRWAAIPSRSPPYSWRPISPGTDVTGSSQPAGTAQSGTGRSTDFANRSGKIW